MKIEHIALYVRDLSGAGEFFCTYFGAKAGPPYHNPKTGFRSLFLSFADGSRLELMTKPGISPDGVPGGQFGYAHMAFSAGSREAVDDLTERLQRDGYACLSGPRVTGDGYYESCIAGFEGNLIEITV